MNLLKETQVLIKRHRGTGPDQITTAVLAKKADVGYQWLLKFSQGYIPDPGVTRLQKVHDYLKKREAMLKLIKERRKQGESVAMVDEEAA